jgi:hypothetical protein
MKSILVQVRYLRKSLLDGLRPQPLT